MKEKKEKTSILKNVFYAVKVIKECSPGFISVQLVSMISSWFFTGFVQGQMLEELYSNAYVYILPSDIEGMPLSLLEAMSYGNCCLTSDIEECTEVTNGHGVTFRKANVEDLTEKLQLLCEDEALVAKYKAEAADYICQRYSWDAVVEQTLFLYRGE